MDNPAARGTVLAAVGALCYGVTVVVGRELADGGLDSATALGTRFAISAVVLAIALRLRRAPVRPMRGEWLRIILLGGVGYGTEAMLFYFALERGTAAAVALLFYVYPAIVTLIELARGREPVRASTLGALGLSVAGTAVVVVAGSDVAISPAGIVFALAAAATFSVYLLVGRELGRRTDSMTAACWVAAGASLSNVARGLATGSLSNPAGHWWVLVLYGLSTAAAFSLTFAALRLLGTSRTAVVMTLEAFSAGVMGALFLGEHVTAVQLAGGVAIVSAAVVIARWSPAAEPGEIPVPEP